ncbi:hypothetical protein RRF57_011111 [Xylaria bambusicola]|uniref:Uncharacterized protein n=1 Tax=Xylaria bambusicola TaxID=326684 RepID=A0AAN7V2A8_9PEZI
MVDGRRQTTSYLRADTATPSIIGREGGRMWAGWARCAATSTFLLGLIFPAMHVEVQMTVSSTNYSLSRGWFAVERISDGASLLNTYATIRDTA